MAYTARGNYLYEPVSATPELSKAIRNFDVAWLAIHSRADDIQLYHYTTAAGLDGILRSRALRFGHAYYFNDPNEINYGQKFVSEIIQNILEEENQKESKEFLEALGNQLRIAFGGAGHNPFMACFCETGDLLSQWRIYSSGGRGYCLGCLVLK